MSLTQSATWEPVRSCPRTELGRRAGRDVLAGRALSRRNVPGSTLQNRGGALGGTVGQTSGSALYWCVSSSFSRSSPTPSNASAPSCASSCCSRTKSRKHRFFLSKSSIDRYRFIAGSLRLRIEAAASLGSPGGGRRARFRGVGGGSGSSSGVGDHRFGGCLWSGRVKESVGHHP